MEEGGAEGKGGIGQGSVSTSSQIPPCRLLESSLKDLRMFSGSFRSSEAGRLPRALRREEVGEDMLVWEMPGY